MSEPPRDEVLLIGEALGADAELCAFLTDQGYQLRSAANGVEGLAAARARGPAVVLVDHELEAKAGVDVLRQLQREVPACQTILVTHTGEMELAIEALRAGALDYLRRPIELDQLRAALARAQERWPSRAAPERPVVLAVDDHQPTLRRLGKVLRKEGYDVLTAADGEEALQIFHSRPVNVILVDLRMPRRDGLTVLRETKGRGADVEVIVMTGYGDESAVVDALRDSAFDFLHKPIDIERMLSAIQNALEHQRVRRSLAPRSAEAETKPELVLRLTEHSRLVVEPSAAISAAARELLPQLVGALQIRVLVTDERRELLFASEHTGWTTAAPRRSLTVDWLQQLGPVDCAPEQLDEALQRVLTAEQATIETVPLSACSVLVLTPVRLIHADDSRQQVVLAIVVQRPAPTGIGRG